ncbi:50S ribosomal protein L13 [Marinithermus hydrothermalis]|uniref:Large ribosomal subunit protein uL13 n=1 Tax=Marinithermus hydrothermalis (strain DSM 14884 / JCM 11576 / T1) TaxID=869210 RepID=F2NM52_MARHT|nr:50S ribosomal protein L13 [Marinithermus hydrothermalis]AEB11522.1 ribosomal protein L13 [Marinithermus hydrothermalis DSM 14884]
MFKTYVPKNIEPKWVLIDAEGKTLGRLASEIAKILRGKHRPEYTPNMLTGDFVVVINAEKVRLTGKKLTDKYYTRYSGYPGGLRKIPVGEMLKKHPERVLQHAVKGMLPKGPLGRRMLKRLKVYAGPTHPHAAQKPEKLELEVK